MWMLDVVFLLLTLYQRLSAKYLYDFYMKVQRRRKKARRVRETWHFKCVVPTCLQVIFALTGFGKFDNVEINPTDVIVKKFPSYLEENPLPFEAAVDRCLVLEVNLLSFTIMVIDDFCCLLQVSADGCKERLSAMHKTCFRDHEDFRVWLHLGVAPSKEEFQLEQVAWNGNDISELCDDKKEEYVVAVVAAAAAVVVMMMMATTVVVV